MSETKKTEPVPPSHFEAQQRELAERKAEARRAFQLWALDSGFFGWFKEALHDANARASLEPRETERIRARLGDKIRAEMHHAAVTSGNPYPPVRVYVSAESGVLDVAFLPIVRRELFAEIPTVASGNCALCELGGYTPHKAGTHRASSAAPAKRSAPRDEPSEDEQTEKREMTEGRRALVAQAFGYFFAALADSMTAGDPWSDYLRENAIKSLSSKMHAALGERIPDRAERPEDAEGWCPK